MAIDRWGNRIIVSWQEHERLWVRAALTLRPQPRTAAFRDIAQLRGCSLEGVRRMATIIRREMLAEGAVVVEVMLGDRTHKLLSPAPHIGPSQLNTGPRMQAMRIGRRA